MFYIFTTLRQSTLFLSISLNQLSVAFTCSRIIVSSFFHHAFMMCPRHSLTARCLRQLFINCYCFIYMFLSYFITMPRSILICVFFLFQKNSPLTKLY